MISNALLRLKTLTNNNRRNYKMLITINLNYNGIERTFQMAEDDFPATTKGNFHLLTSDVLNNEIMKQHPHNIHEYLECAENVILKKFK
jgi:hypothetical protein